MTGNGTFAFRGHVDASVLRSDIRLLSSIPWNESTRQPRFASALTSGVGNAAWRRAILDNLPTRHSRTGAAPNDDRGMCNVVFRRDTAARAPRRTTLVTSAMLCDFPTRHSRQRRGFPRTERVARGASYLRAEVSPRLDCTGRGEERKDLGWSDVSLRRPFRKTVTLKLTNKP